MKRISSEACWFAATCLAMIFLGLTFKALELQSLADWTLAQLAPLIVAAAAAVVAMLLLMVAAYRKENPRGGRAQYW